MNREVIKNECTLKHQKVPLLRAREGRDILENIKINQEAVRKLMKELDPYIKLVVQIASHHLYPKKECAETLSKPLVMFKIALDQGKILRQWWRANVTPIFKKK